ncbi:histidinol-phosphate aminotransferase, partial [Helicobacter bilis ATCC 43879]
SPLRNHTTESSVQTPTKVAQVATTNTTHKAQLEPKGFEFKPFRFQHIYVIQTIQLAHCTIY